MKKTYKIIGISLVVLIVIILILLIQFFVRQEQNLTFEQDLKCREYGEREYPGYEGMDIDYLYSQKLNSCIGIINDENSTTLIDLYKTKNLITYWEYNECKQLSNEPEKCTTREAFEKEKTDLIGR